MLEVVISKSTKPYKKYDAVFNGTKTVSFGAKGYQDYTIHKDPERKERYINRHKKNEDWTRSGIDTPGFLSRFILWNQPTLQESIKDLNTRYKDVHFKLI